MHTAAKGLRTLWRMLGSTRLAVVLLAALLLTSLVASLFPQMPTSVAPVRAFGTLAEAPEAIAARESWLEAAVLRYGRATGLLRSLGLFDAYHSPWFLALVCALLLSTLICTIQRLPRLWRSFANEPDVVRPEAFFRGSDHRAEWPVASGQAGVDMARRALQARRYAVHVQHDGVAPCAYVYAERGRWSRLCTLVGHAAALILASLVVARPAVGWQEQAILLLPGQVYSVGHEAGFAIQAGELVVDRTPDDQPRDYAVPLTVLAEGSPVLTETVRLNHPLTYRRVAFHLQGYGPAARLATPGGTIDLAFHDVRAHEVTLPDAGVVLRAAYHPERDTLFVEALAPDGSLLGSGSVADGQQIEIQGLPIAFTLGRYTIWQASHDPTFVPALSMGGLLLLAALASLWAAHRRIWLRVSGESAVMVAAAAGRDFEALAGILAEQAPQQAQTTLLGPEAGDHG